MLYYTANTGDLHRRHIWKITLPDGKREQLTKGKGIEWSPVITTSGIALLRSSATRPHGLPFYREEP